MFICDHKSFKSLAVYENINEVTFPLLLYILKKKRQSFSQHLKGPQNLSQTIKEMTTFFHLRLTTLKFIDYTCFHVLFSKFYFW